MSTDSGVSKLRFFGKIRGTENDYYVAEGELEGGEEPEDEEAEERPADFEPKGTGINRLTYWVSHQSFAQWTKLPDLNPKDVEAARSMKVLFTGDLNRTIYTNPFFFKREKEYLRAQIARISHSTTLAPVGLFRPTEDDPRQIEPVEPEGDEEEVKKPTTQQMSQAKMWCHYNDSILKNNRTAHLEPEAPEDGEDADVDPEELMKQVIAKDPFEPKLKLITDDSQVVISKNKKI